MHGDEIKYVNEAYESNWMSTIGENIDAVERLAASSAGMKYAVALCNCTSALHLCVKLAAESLYGRPSIGHRTLEGKKVFCSDMTFNATLNSVIYECGTPVFIDIDKESWNMDPVALERAFEKFPDVKIVVYAELYGFPGKVNLIKEICARHGAVLIEDAAEAMGAFVEGRPCGSFGDYSAVSYNGNKIITGSSGGCLLSNSREDAEKARKWSTQSRDDAPWYQHSETGYNYRMSNVVAGVIRGQYAHLEEHIAQKKAVYERYEEGLKGLPVKMNPVAEGTIPNYWLSSMTIDGGYMCKQDRTDSAAAFVPEKGKTCPTEILEALSLINAEGRPIWKPLHLQPLYSGMAYVGKNGLIKPAGYGKTGDEGADVFARGLCLPSDNKMTPESQDVVIEVIRRCFE